MVDNGIVFGRFQLLYLKQMEYLLAVKMRCKKLIIGITKPDGVRGKERKDFDNPFTYYERFEMIRDALLDFGVKREEFEIVPFPMEHPERILNYVPKNSVLYMDILGEESGEKLNVMEAMNLKADVVRRKHSGVRGKTDAEIRMLIAKGREWKWEVPKSVYEYVVSHRLDKRVQRIYKEIHEEISEEINEKINEETVLEAAQETVENIEKPTEEKVLQTEKKPEEQAEIEEKSDKEEE